MDSILEPYLAVLYGSKFVKPLQGPPAALRIEISPGQVHDSLFAETLLEGFDATDYVIAVLAPISTGQPGIALEAWGYP